MFEETVNILKRAEHLGAELDPNEDFLTILTDAENYILDNAPAESWSYEEVENPGSHSPGGVSRQSFHWSDGLRSIEESGSVCDFSETDTVEEEKVFVVKDVVDSNGCAVRLYCK